MTPNLLAIIGASIATFASLGTALSASDKVKARAQLVLSLPLLVTAVMCYISPKAFLTLWGHQASNGELVNLTLQYDRPAQGIGVIESVLSADHPYAMGFTIAFGLCAFITLWSIMLRDRHSAKRNSILGLSTSVWFVAWCAWLMTHVTPPFVSHSGESGVRSFIRWSALDIQRVSQFVIPDGSWRYVTNGGLLISLSLLSALLLALSAFGIIGSSQISQSEERSYHLGALLCVVAAVWLGVTQGFYGSQGELALWLGAIAMGSASSTGLPRISKATIGMLSLLMLVAGVY
jgi:hypothetical protein